VGEVRDAKKCVVVVDGGLPVGPLANTATVLAVTLGSRIGAIVGDDAIDGSGEAHAGLTRLPIPVLEADADTVKGIRLKASGTGLLLVDFTDAAQAPRDYAEYLENISRVQTEDLKYLGVALYGEKKPINKLTGGLPLLR
jgi:hypothetical protein